MKVTDGKHWDIYQILPYQRNFNLINGPRSIGKTYTAQYYILDKCLEKGFEFVYVVRTQDEKKGGILGDSFRKVLANQFPHITYKATTEELMRVIEDENGDVEETITLGYCIALSEAYKVKKRSFPNVKYMIFDEYTLEESTSVKYVNGWKEPDLLLSLYHTIDREEDRVIVFMLGNNTKFHNPYHIHPAFNIPPIQKGGIWTSENVLFQYAEGSDSLSEQQSKCRFLNMIKESQYSTYANKGEYIYDNYSFIGKMTSNAFYFCTIYYMGDGYGIYNDTKNGLLYITNKVDKCYPISYALTKDDHSENTMLTKTKGAHHLNWIAKNYSLGNVRFESMEIKEKIEKGIVMLL